MEIKKIKCIQEDERGSITDIVEQVDFNGATIILSMSGSVRGNHFHKKTFQHVYILSGKMKCLAQKPKQKVIMATVEPGDLVSHDLLESHSFEALEDTLFLVLSSGLRTGKDYEKDTYRLESPLKI